MVLVEVNIEHSLLDRKQIHSNIGRQGTSNFGRQQMFSSTGGQGTLSDSPCIYLVYIYVIVIISSAR